MNRTANPFPENGSGPFHTPSGRTYRVNIENPPTGHWELDTHTENATPEPLSNAARVLAMATVAVAFIGLGLFLTL